MNHLPLNTSQTEYLLSHCGEDVYAFISPLVDLETATIAIVETNDPTSIHQQIKTPPQGIINLSPINSCHNLNGLFTSTNQHLQNGGIYIGCLETLEQRKIRIHSRYPSGLGRFIYTLDFIFERVLPKLPITRELYSWTAGERNRALSFTETLGRLVYGGFDIISSYQADRVTYFAAKRAREPMTIGPPSTGPIFKMRRKGKDGKIIHVYKFRTMHPYAQFLQAYVYELNGLQDGIKISNDFRITSWGRFLRKTWLDELPMVANLIKGDLKLIGPRPLSEQRLSLYTPDVIELRQRYKPGLLPPYYADLPKTLAGVIKSERQYLEAYQEAPLRTDIRYFFKILENITIKRARGM